MNPPKKEGRGEDKRNILIAPFQRTGLVSMDTDLNA
jgi:hypothetical protein